MAGPFTYLQVDLSTIVPELKAPPGSSAVSDPVLSRFFNCPAAIEIVERVMTAVVRAQTRFVVFVDRRGRHRSIVAAYLVEEALNMLVDDAGGRSANAKVFVAGSAVGGNDELEDRLRAIRSWAEQPWHLCHGGPKAADRRLGYGFCMGSAVATAGFLRWHSWLESQFWLVPEDGLSTIEIVGQARPAPTSAAASAYPREERPLAATVATPPPSAIDAAITNPPASDLPPSGPRSMVRLAPPSRIVIEDPSTIESADFAAPVGLAARDWLEPADEEAPLLPEFRGSVASAQRRSNKMASVVVDSSDEEEVVPLRVAAAHAPVADDEDWGARWPAASSVDDPSLIAAAAPRTPPRPPSWAQAASTVEGPSACGASSSVAVDDRNPWAAWAPAPSTAAEEPAGEPSMVDSPPDISGEGPITGRKRFHWETFEPKVENWASTLEEFGVDIPARQSLFALAQHSREGYELANDLIAKLVKKVADRSWARNPSGFVHACCKNARHRLSPRTW